MSEAKSRNQIMEALVQLQNDCPHDNGFGEFGGVGVCNICGRSQVGILEERIQQLESQLEEAGDRISKYLSGECICPHSTGSAYHFPGCPEILKQQLSNSEEAVGELVSILDEILAYETAYPDSCQIDLDLSEKAQALITKHSKATG
jgi:hypothetical protein